MNQTTLILITIIILPIFAQAQFNKYPIPYRKGDKWGYCDEDKNIIVEPIYTSATIFVEEEGLGIAKVGINDSYYGYLDTSGKLILPVTYFYLGKIGAIKDETTSKMIYYSFAQKRGSNKYGIVSLDGNNIELIPFEYDWIRLSLKNGKYLSCTGQKDRQIYELNPLTGESTSLTIKEYKRQYVETIYVPAPLSGQKIQGQLELSEEEKKVILTRNKRHFSAIHKEVLNKARFNEYRETGYFNTDRHFYKIYKKGKVGVVEKVELNKKKVKKYIKPQYDSIAQVVRPTLFKGQYYFIAIKQGKTGVINYDNEVIIPFDYDEINYYSKGFQLRRGDKYGLADPDRDIFIAAKYEYITTLSSFGYRDESYEIFMIRSKDNQELKGYINRFGVEYFEN